MVVEYIRYTIDEGRAEAFQQAYGRAAEAPMLKRKARLRRADRTRGCSACCMCIRGCHQWWEPRLAAPSST
jgi:hypothetical protein